MAHSPRPRRHWRRIAWPRLFWWRGTAAIVCIVCACLVPLDDTAASAPDGRGVCLRCCADLIADDD